MHEKCFKIDFFANFRKLQKKLTICKKRYAEILNVDRAVVTNVEKNSNRHSEFFLVPQKSRQTVGTTAKINWFGDINCHFLLDIRLCNTFLNPWALIELHYHSLNGDSIVQCLNQNWWNGNLQYPKLVHRHTFSGTVLRFDHPKPNRHKLTFRMTI